MTARYAAPITCAGLCLLALAPHLGGAQAQTPRATPVVQGFFMDVEACGAYVEEHTDSRTMPMNAGTEEGGGHFFITMSDPSPAARATLVEWGQAIAPPNRRFLVIPVDDHGAPFGWRGYCVSSDPVVASEEIVFGDEDVSMSNATREVRSITFAPSALMRLRAIPSVNLRLVFVSGTDALHGIQTLASIVATGTTKLGFDRPAARGRR